MKLFKKVMLMILSFAMMISLAQMTADVQASTSFYYVALGDSGTAGYTLADAGTNVADPTKNYKADSSSTYGNIVGNKLMSLTGNTGSVYSYYSNLGTVNATIADMQKSLTDSSDPYYSLYNTELKKATDITVSCGTTDFLDQILNMIVDMGMGENFTENTYNGMTVYDNADNPLLAAAYALISQMANGKVYTQESLTADINTLIDYYADSVDANTATGMMNLDEDTISAQAEAGMEEALARYGTMLDSIAALNGNADLYVVGMYKEFGTELNYNGKTYTLDAITSELTSNLASYLLQMTLKGSKSVAQSILKQYGYQLFYLASGEIYDTAVDRVNEYLKDYCAQKGYTYVDVSSLSSDSDLNPYPDVSEHAYIAEQIYNAMAPKYTTAAHTHEYVENVIQPTLHSQGYTVHTCTICGDTYTDHYTDQLTFPFTDVPESKWYYTWVYKAYDYTLMTGKTTTTFDPSANMNRGQVAVVLYRMAGSPEVEYTGKFSDVPANKYYASAIEWAAVSGIVTGYKDGTFKPSDNITRQDFVLMLYRYAKSIGADISVKADLSEYPDASNVSGYASEAMQWAVANGIITGKKLNGQSYIDPKATATRAECCKMLVVTYEMLNGIE